MSYWEGSNYEWRKEDKGKTLSKKLPDNFTAHTQEDVHWIKLNYTTHSVKAMADHLNMTEQTIRYIMKFHNLKTIQP